MEWRGRPRHRRVPGGIALAPDQVTRAAASGWLGFARVERGDGAAAIALLEGAVRQFSDFGMRHAQGGFMAGLAEAYLLVGDLERAEATGRRSLEITRGAESPHGVGGAEQTLAKIALARGHLDAAERYGQDAIRTFSACEAPFEVGRTHLVLARVAAASGNSPAARGHVRTALGIFTRLDVPRYQERAAVLARALGLPLPPGRPLPGKEQDPAPAIRESGPGQAPR